MNKPISEVEKMYKRVGVKPEYRYDCNLADTIKPIEVFPLRSCSKGEMKDYCTNKQDYRYCKVYKVNKIYPPFTAEKQLELIKWCLDNYRGEIFDTIETTEWFEEQLCAYINNEWEDLTEEERKQIKNILE